MNPLVALSAAAALALVAEDGTALRSAPSDAATAQAVLYRGDWLELRGEAPGFLKVWDHRRERGGYVRPNAVRVHSLPGKEGPAPETIAAELAAVVRFLRDAPGFESLGIAYATLHGQLPAGPAPAQRAAVVSALGEMAERLGRRASGAVTAGARGDSVLAGQVSVAESYGVGFRRFERGGRVIVCYDGDAFMRVLRGPGAAPELLARAALSLTRRGCLDPALTAVQRRAWNEARLEVLAAVDAALTRGEVPATWAYRLRLRGAEALAEKAHDEAAQGRVDRAAGAAAESLRRLALVDRGRLAPEDGTIYEETTVRVAALRWLAEPPPPARRPTVTLALAPSRPGETCVRLGTAAPATSKPTPPAASASASDKPTPPAASASATSKPTPPAAFVERCTYGVVLPSSLRVAPSGRAAALAVAPLPGWTELWIFRADASLPAGWRVEVIPPGAGEPGDDIGYVELAGFSPDGRRLLVARELRTSARLTRRFELFAPDSTRVEHWSSSADHLRAFQRWASPLWRQSTLALR